MEVVSIILLVILTVFRTSTLLTLSKTAYVTDRPLVPPVGVYCVAGCGADLLINICLTILGYFPGHIQYVFPSQSRLVELLGLC